MLFSSFEFLFAFLPLFLITYFLVPTWLKNSVALAGSLAFYAWGAPQFLPVLLIMSIVDYAAGGLIARMADRNPLRVPILLGAVGLNLTVLGYFKYFSFLGSELNRLFHATGLSWQVALPRVTLPIGLSFIAFQEISYLADLFLRRTGPAKSFGNYLLYLCLFPHSIAGPIVRWESIRSSIERKRGFDIAQAERGIVRFCFGMAKKVLIADQLSYLSVTVFDGHPANLPVWLCWLGLLAYALQIYYDFSGYSDMAIGLGAMIGIPIGENFNHPYCARSITEFWSRWHISLTQWLRDYLYQPLVLCGTGGPLFRWTVGTLVVFLLSGIWHGAGWQFVAWGAYHGVLVLADRLFWSDKVARKLPPLVNQGITFFSVLIGFVFFRSASLTSASEFFLRLFTRAAIVPVRLPLETQQLFGLRTFWLIGVATLGALLRPGFEKGILDLRERLSWQGIWLRVRLPASLVFLGLSILTLVVDQHHPFLYFNF